MQKIKLTIILIFFTNIILCQDYIFKLEDELSLPVVNALIFVNGKYLCKSNSNGAVLIEQKLKIIDTLTIVKETYYDLQISVSDIKSSLKLRSIKPIELNEIIIKPINISAILDSTYLNITSLNHKYNYSKSQHFFNLFTINADTLCYVNKTIQQKDNKKWYIADNFKLINKFSLTNQKEPIFIINNKKYNFLNHLNFNSLPHNSTELLLITKFQKNFKYSIVGNDSIYKISFYPKNNNSEFKHSGYIIINNYDYNILEYKIEIENQKVILPNKNENSITKYMIIFENSYAKFKKNSNTSNYDFISYSLKSKFKILDKYLKDKTLTVECYKEPTNLINEPNNYEFDISTYQAKKNNN